MVTICCIASGPSLVAEDCALIERSGLKTIAINNSWQMARFADYIYAGDKSWWHVNADKIDIPAKRISCDASASKRFNTATHLPSGGYNSGMMAIRYAMFRLEARRVILLGYDCSVANGIHWHGPHEKLKNPDATRVAKWVKQFEKVSEEAKALGVQVINCSRDTALTCFERKPLAEVL